MGWLPVSFANWTKRMDPIRVKFLHKSTKWTDPRGIKILFHKVDGPNKSQKTYTSPQSGWTPRGIKILVRKVVGPNKGQKPYTSPQGGWNPQGIKIHIHKVDGPTRVKNLHKSTKWTDPTRDQDSSPQSGRTQQGSNLHKSTKWTDTTKSNYLTKFTK